ncbi:MAG: hypothetical protein NWE93_09090 [Candidatus Bathyarchaeota archaeon]|nr:hypothetical protein [Candidatus Bathyarchaeota archaeon]
MRIKLNRFTAVVLAAVVFIFVSSGILAWSYRESLDSDSNLASLQQIRDETILYLVANHTETAKLTSNLSWTGGLVEEGVLGSETYLFTSGNWQIQVTYPVVKSPLYSISANYSSPEATVIWKGTYQNGILKEVSSDILVSTSGALSQAQIRDLTMNYVKTFHNETASYMQALAWTGGKATTEGIVGSETYCYMSGLWNLTLQYPVVAAPIYTIAVQYDTSSDLGLGSATINWQGTFQEGLIIEKAYNYTP